MGLHNSDSDCTECIDFGLAYRQLFCNRVAFDLQLLQVAVGETVFALASLAAEIKFVHITALT